VKEEGVAAKANASGLRENNASPDGYRGSAAKPLLMTSSEATR
jgi:hypothetical protein